MTNNNRYGLFSLALTAFPLCLAASIAASEELTIQDMATPAATGSAEPHLAKGANGEVVLSWLEPDGGGVALRYSTLLTSGWSSPGHVARGDNWFVNWADFPSVVPLQNNTWAAHWLVKRPGNAYAYDVAVALSENAGETWSQPITPHSDGTATEHGFVSLFDAPDGVGMLWLDGRNMAGGHGHGHDSAPAESGMTLRSAVLGNDLAVRHERIADGLVCDCCQTDITKGPGGPVAVYRNRTTDEIRDIYVTRMIHGEWTAGQPVANDGWEIAGCPVNGPAIDAYGNNVSVAWFTAADNVSKVRVATSNDGGSSFAAAIDIATDHPTGRVDVATLDNGHVLVSWLQDGQNGDGDICVRSVSPAGELGETLVVASTSRGRMSGFPQMLVSGDNIIMAWTDVDDDGTSVGSATLPVRLLIP